MHCLQVILKTKIMLCTRVLVTLKLVLLFSATSSSLASEEPGFTQQEINAISSHGPWPGQIPHDPGNELSGLAWAEELGKSLFFDNRLSANQSISCATCHQHNFGFSDNRPQAVGVAQGVRNTQGLLDVGLQRWFGWDGGADSLWAASIRPMLNAREMGNDINMLASTLRDNRQLIDSLHGHVKQLSLPKSADSTNFASPSIKVNELSDESVIALAAKAIAAYMRTLRSKKTSFDYFREALINNNVSAQADYPVSAKRGLKLFIGEANCRVCHFGPNFFTSVGQVDPGRYTGIQRVRKDQFNLLGEHANKSNKQIEKHLLKTANVKLTQANWGQWRTPSLRNLELTPPYMHDGSLAGLSDVVDAYADIDLARLHSKGESILKPLNLSRQQRNDLVSFLRTLTAPN